MNLLVKGDSPLLAGALSRAIGAILVQHTVHARDKSESAIAIGSLVVEVVRQMIPNQRWRQLARAKIERVETRALFF